MSPPQVAWIAVVLDRSGSMESRRDDAIGGFNAFVEEQQAQPGAALLFLAQFDDHHDVLADGVPLQEAPRLTRATFEPRGSTALLDAIGRMVLLLEKRLEEAPVSDRPANVCVLTITDGKENASTGFKASDIARMVREHEARDGWRFIFFGTTAEAVVAASRDLGMDSSRTHPFRAVRDAFTRASREVSVQRTEVSMAQRDLHREPDPKKRMN